MRKAKVIIRKSVSAAINPRYSVRKVRRGVKKRLVNRNRYIAYKKWFANYELGANDVESQKQDIAGFSNTPLISVILPIYNTPEHYLKLCIDSVVNQSYSNWELCIADDASTSDIVHRIEEYTKDNHKIKIMRSKVNQHIAGASNVALKVAKGEYVALLDHDDLLLPNSLYEVVKKLNQYPDTDLVYTDEDKVEDGKGHIEPFFKPDWSPDFLRSCNYITHFAVLRRSVVEKIGGFRVGTEGAQDWDLFLRFTQETDKIQHIPKILYTWRKSPTSTAKTAKSKPYAYLNQLKVLRDDTAKRSLTASVFHTKYSGFWQLRYHIQQGPKLSIIVPTKNNYKVLRSCIESIIEKSSYPNFEIIIVDNGSTSKEVTQFYKSKLITSNDVKIIFWDKPFNFSAVCNVGAAKSSGEYLLFLNDDTEVITTDWMEKLLGICQQEGVGAVGCKLLFPNKHIQHAGVVLSDKDVAIHPSYGQDHGLDIFTTIYIENIHNVSAVTAACLMVSTEKFKKVNGFDEELRVTYNDVDLCLKLLKAGYRNVYTPYAELYHYESVSVGRVGTDNRDNTELLAAQTLMKKRWPELLSRDPYYNDNFDTTGIGYQLRNQ